MGVTAKSSAEDYEEIDPFFNFAERVWVKPCMEKVPREVHGLCMYFPAFGFMMIFVLGVALLAYCANPPKEAPPPPKSTDKKKDTKKSK